LRRLAPLLAAAAALVAAGCGGSSSGGPAPPRGPAAERHPTSQIAAAQAAEEMRAQLVAATQLYNVGHPLESSAHMKAAAGDYSRISDEVRRSQPVLDREIHAAFGVIAGQIAHKAASPAVALRIGLVQGQLMDAAIAAAVPVAARDDPGVGATVISRLAAQGAAAYSAAAREGQTPVGKRQFQDAFGLVSRALSVSHGEGASLGPVRVTVLKGLGAAHNDGFPFGVLMPKAALQAAKVRSDVARVQAALNRRFGFGA
jgi:hypothetical protein